MNMGKVVLVSLMVALGMVPAVAAEGLMLCRAGEGESTRQWLVRLRLGTVQAEVDGRMVQAEYQPSHARLTLSDGSALTIGRSTGRLLVTGANGRPQTSGTCGMAGLQA